jgi:aldehyde:ferredoxin oxidoreductase
MIRTKHNWDLEDIRSKHKLLAEYRYDKAPLDRGYNRRSLHVDVGKLSITEKPVSDEMIERFTGGKGFGMKMLWDATRPETKWNDPENEIVFSFGPICGITQYAGTGKTLVVSLSPATDIPIDSNVGGYFGPYVKFSGFDAFELQGIAEEDVIVYIDGDEGLIQIFTAPDEEVDSHLLAEQLIEMYARDEQEKKCFATVSAGQGSDTSYIGCLNFSFYDRRRQMARLKQAGRGGIGSVLRAKKVKALVVKFSSLTPNNNGVADMEELKRVGSKYHREVYENDDAQCDMRHTGTPHLMEIMSAYDLLPTKNFKYGGDQKQIGKVASYIWREMFTQGIPDGCWYGCSMACAKVIDNYILRTGPYKGQVVSVDGPEYETAGASTNMFIFDPHFIAEMNFYCDTYGVDTISYGTTMAFVMECFENGVIDLEKTGGLDLSFGRAEESMEILHQIARGEGFGLLVGKGIRWLKNYFVENYGADRNFLEDIGMEGKGLECSQYVSKESLAQQGGYFIANKGPQHDEAWLIFMDMVNNHIPTFEDKAQALYYFPIWRTWFGLQGLCKLPWNDVEPADNATTSEPAKVPEHVQNYVDIYNAVTGKSITKDDVIKQSERVFNFQRIFAIRRGYGTRKHDRCPYRGMGPVTAEEYESRAERYDKQLKTILGVEPEGKSTKEKMAILRTYREDRYQKLLDAVYLRRGWSPDAVPTPEHLKNIGMDLPELLEVVRAHI